MGKKYLLSLLLLFLPLSLLAREFPVCKEYFYIQEGEKEQKRSFLEKILKEDPGNVECMLKLASVYLRTNKVAEGFDLIRRAYTLDPKYVESRNISKILDLALRLSRLQELARKNRDYTLWNELGDTYFDIGIFEEAARAYEESLAIEPSQTKIEILLAISYANTDRAAKAAKLLRKIVEKEPYNFYANYYLGKILINEMKDPTEGEKYLMMAAYLLKYGHPKFEKEQERPFFEHDLAKELEAF